MSHVWTLCLECSRAKGPFSLAMRLDRTVNYFKSSMHDTKTNRIAFVEAGKSGSLAKYTAKVTGNLSISGTCRVRCKQRKMGDFDAMRKCRNPVSRQRSHIVGYGP